jgi:hypothetical protein
MAEDGQNGPRAGSFMPTLEEGVALTLFFHLGDFPINDEVTKASPCFHRGHRSGPNSAFLRGTEDCCALAGQTEPSNGTLG